jgi:NTE family protein
MKALPQKIGLALGGGSTYGIAHIGALVALAEAKIPIDCIAGTSAGSLVAACYAFRMPLADMVSLSENLKWKKFSRFAYSPLGLRNNKRMGTFITDTLGAVHIEDAPIPLAIVATNIETHEMAILRKGALHEAVRASTCLPGIFTPVEIDGALLVDGGLTENVPLTALDEMGATMKIAINFLGSPHSTKPRNVFDVLGTSVTILSKHRDQHLSTHADILIEPNLSQLDASNFKAADDMLEAGYQAAYAAIPQIRAKLAEMNPEPKFSFRKMFSKLLK